MTGQDLKNSILQLAIQGKLVPQNPDDEPASVLLERIKAEKKKLIEEKKIKKEKPLPEITEDEMPFEIPEGWVWCRLGEIASIYGGKRIPAGSKLSNDQTGHVYIRVADMKNSTVNLNDLKYISDEIYQKIKQYTIGKDDLYITVAGTIGAIGEIPSCLDGANLTENADKIVFRNVYKKFLLFALKSNVVQAQILEATTKVGQPKLAILRIQRFLIPLPPLSEQRRIVAKIEELMPLVDEYDKAQKELDSLNSAMPEQLKQSLLQEAIMGKLGTNNPDDEPASVLLQRIREEKAQLIKDKKIKKEKPLPEITDEEKPFDIPDNWVWCRICDISNSYIGLTYKPSDVSEKGTVVLRSSNIQNGKIDLSDIVKVNMPIPEKLQVQENDILICARNGSAKLVGKSAIISKQAEGMSFGAFMAICKTDFYAYVFCFLQSDLFFSQLRTVSGTTTINQLTQKNFNSFLIPLPPLAEQKRIVSKIENLFACIEPLAKDVK